MGLNKVEVRDAVVKDIDVLVMLLEQLFSIEKDFIFNAERQRKGLLMMIEGCGKHRAVKVAEYNGNVVGMCSVQTRISTARGANVAVMEDLIVDSTLRKSGIGSKLSEAVFEWSRKRGIGHIQLLADMDNQAALDFYSHQNWNRTNLVCLTKTL